MPPLRTVWELRADAFGNSPQLRRLRLLAAMFGAARRLRDGSDVAELGYQSCRGALYGAVLEVTG